MSFDDALTPPPPRPDVQGPRRQILRLSSTATPMATPPSSPDDARGPRQPSVKVYVNSPKGHTPVTTHQGSTVLTLRLWAARALTVPADAIFVEHGHGTHWSHLMDGVELVNRSTYTVRTMFQPRQSLLEDPTPPPSGSPPRPRRAPATGPLSASPTVLGVVDPPTKRPRPPSNDGDLPMAAGDSDTTDNVEYRTFIVAKGRGRAALEQARQDAAAVKALRLPPDFAARVPISSPLATIVAVLGVYVVRLTPLYYHLACAVRNTDGVIVVMKISPSRAPAALRTATIACLEDREPVPLDARPPIPMTVATERLKAALTSVFEARGRSWLIYDRYGNEVLVQDEETVSLSGTSSCPPLWEDDPSEDGGAVPTVAVAGVGDVVAANPAWAALPAELRDHLSPDPPAPPAPAPVAHVPSSSRHSEGRLCYVRTAVVRSAALAAAATAGREWDTDVMEAGMAVAAEMGSDRRWAFHVSCVAPGSNPPPIPPADRHFVAVFHGAHWSAAMVEGDVVHCMDSLANSESLSQAAAYLALLGFPVERMTVQPLASSIPKQGAGNNCGPAAITFVWLMALERGVSTKASTAQVPVRARLSPLPVNTGGKLAGIGGCHYQAWRILISRVLNSLASCVPPAEHATHLNPWVLRGRPVRPSISPLCASRLCPHPPTPGNEVPRALAPIQAGATVRDVSDDSGGAVGAAQ